MPEITVLTERDLREHIKLDMGVVLSVGQALSSLARDDVVMPPILHLAIAEHNGEIDVKTAYVPGIDSIAVKISPGFFDNPKLGLPSLNGLMVLFSARTGTLEALLLDNGYLTDIRTAAAGAVAAQRLAREDASSAGILGGGAQGYLQLEALTLVRPIRQARIWARRPEQAEDIARRANETLGLEATAVGEPEQAVTGSDVVVTATPSREPLVRAAWLSPGQHLTAMGSDADYKNELEPAVVARADLYACDRVAQCLLLGELHHAVAAGKVDPDTRPVELAEILSDRAPGRGSDTDITVADLTGTGDQDTGIGTLAYNRCRAAGLGSTFES